MSELFAVQVAEVSPQSVKLAVRSVHPDSGPVAPSATFALQLIYDPILNSGYSAFRAHRHLEASPLAQVMDVESYLDPAWVQANARAFVAKAKVSRGVLEIWPTHPGWTEHLRKGMAWDTAAYDDGPGARAKVARAGVAQGAGGRERRRGREAREEGGQDGGEEGGQDGGQSGWQESGEEGRPEDGEDGRPEDGEEGRPEDGEDGREARANG